MVHSILHTDHPASIRVLEKAGLVREAEEQDADGVYFLYACGTPAAGSCAPG